MTPTNSPTMGAPHPLRRHPAITDPDRHAFTLRLTPPSTDVDVVMTVVDVAVVKMVVVVDVAAMPTAVLADTTGCMWPLAEDAGLLVGRTRGR